MEIFDEVELQKVEADYSKLVIEPHQRQNVHQISQLLSQTLPLSEITLRGFIWNAFIQYQKKNNFYIADGVEVSKEMKLKMTIEIGAIVKDNLIKILKNKTDEKIVVNGFNRAITYYKNHLLI